MKVELLFNCKKKFRIEILIIFVFKNNFLRTQESIFLKYNLLSFLSWHFHVWNSSVMRPKDNSQSRCLKKQIAPNFPKNEHLLPRDTHTYMYVSGGKKCLFSGKLGLLCFLETPDLRSALLPYYPHNFYLSTRFRRLHINWFDSRCFVHMNIQNLIMM